MDSFIEKISFQQCLLDHQFLRSNDQVIDFDENKMLVRMTDENYLLHVLLEETAEFGRHLIFDYVSDADSFISLMPSLSLQAHRFASGVLQFRLLISRFQRILFQGGVLFSPKFLYFSGVSC